MPLPLQLTERLRMLHGGKWCLTLLPALILNAFVTSQFLFNTSGFVYFAGGINLMPFQPVQLGRDLLLSTWSPANFGAPNSPNPSILLVLALQELVGARLSVIAVDLLPYWVASISMWLLLTRGTFAKSPITLTIGPMVYSYNWVTMFHVGDIYALYPYSVLPALILFTARITSDERPRLTDVLGFTLALAVGSLISSLISVAFLFPGVLIGFLFSIMYSRRRMLALARSIPVLVLGFLLYLLLLLPFIWPQVIGVFTRGVTGYASSLGFNVPSSYLEFVHPELFTLYLPSLISPFLILTSPIPNSLMGSLGVVLSALCFASLVHDKSRIRVLGMSAAAVLLMYVAVTILIMNGNDVVNLLGEYLPILVPLSGFGWYSTILGMLLGLLAPLGLDAVISRLSIAHGRGSLALHALPGKTVVAIGFVLLLVASSTPIASQNLLVSNMPRASANSNSPLFEFAPNTIELSRQFNEIRVSQGLFRVLWLPEFSHQNQILLANDEMSSFQIGSLLDHPGLMNVMNNLVSEMNSGQGYSNDTVAAILAQLGFRYIVVLQVNSTGGIFIDQSGIDRYLEGGSQTFMNLFSNQPSIRPINVTNKYVVYENSAYTDSGVQGLFWTFSNGTLLNAWPPDTDTTIRVSAQYPFFSPSSFSLVLNTSRPTWLVFSGNYDDNWQAYIRQPNGSYHELEHAEALGWANAFFIPSSGINSVELSYSPQATQNFVILIWPILAASVLLLPLLGYCLGHLRGSPRYGKLKESRQNFASTRKV